MSEGLRRIHVICVVLTSLWAVGFLVASAAGFYDAWQDSIAAEHRRQWEAATVVRTSGPGDRYRPVAATKGRIMRALSAADAAGDVESARKLAAAYRAADAAPVKPMPNEYEQAPVVEDWRGDDSYLEPALGEAAPERPVFEVRTPDGKKYRITAPPGTTPHQARTYAANQFGPPLVYPSSPEEPYFLAAAAFMPAAGYWTVAWVIAGFLRDRQERQQQKGEA